MRRDMHKVLCERPRWGMRMKRRSRYRGPIEDAPFFESSSRTRGGTKYPSERLGPLKRWLRRQVGRPWDAVYSELRRNISPDNAVQMHIWQHADHFVARNVTLRGKTPFHNSPHSAAGEPVWAGQCPVFVCPKTGVLKATPQRARRRGPG